MHIKLLFSWSQPQGFFTSKAPMIAKLTVLAAESKQPQIQGFTPTVSGLNLSTQPPAEGEAAMLTAHLDPLKSSR